MANGTTFSDAMQQISLLLQARDNIALPKVGATTGTNLLGKLAKGGKYAAKPLLEGIGLGSVTHLIP